jgi:hypothetical protein
MIFRDIATRTSCVITRGWFPALWLFIGLVSAIDTYLTIRFRDLMWQLEKNPMGRFLIALDDGNVTVFIRVKAAGTVVVMSVLAGLYVYRRHWSFPITSSIAAFQFALLIYVVLSSPLGRPPGLLNSAVAIDGTHCPRTVWDDISALLPTSGWEPPCDAVRSQ